MKNNHASRQASEAATHLYAINQLIEKSLEYNKPLCLAFVDYKKAFDSVEHATVFNLMREQGVNENYMQVIQNIHEDDTAIISLHKDTNKIKIAKGVS